MKNFFRFVMAAAVLFGAVACSQNQVEEVVGNEEITTTFTVGLENLGTRATTAGTAKMITNVKYGIYDVNANGKYLPISGDVEFDQAKGSAEIAVTLFTGKTYDLVFWAYDAANTTAYDVDMENRVVTVNYENLAANDESRDAFFHIENGFVAGPSRTFTLKRPFAQLNAGQNQTDLDAMAATDNRIVSSYVHTQAYETLSLVDGGVEGDKVDVNYANAYVIDGETLTVNNEEFKSISMNYLLVNTKDLVNATFYFVGDEGTTFERPFTNVPVQRNYRTNILGQLISAPSVFTIVIDANFEGDHEVKTLTEPAVINNGNELLSLLNDAIIGEISLVADVDANNETLMIRDGSNIVLNGNSNDIIAGSTAGYGLRITNNANITINDTNLVGGGINAQNGATVTFNDGSIKNTSASTSQRHIFYAGGRNAVIIVNDGDFSFELTRQRSYAAADYGGKIYINGGNFGPAPTHPRWKHPIYTAEGGEVIITGGTFQFDPSTWVAPGYKAVKSGNKWYVIADSVSSVYTNAADLQEAINNANDGAVLAVAGTIEGLVDLTNKNLTIEAAGDATIKGMLWANNTTAVVKGLTLSNPNGVQHPNPTNSKYYKEINDKNPLVGAYLNSNLTFENCVFNIVAPTTYGFYGYATINPVFEACTFNCNGIRPIANNGDSIVVNGCTFNDQYHYSVRIFENAGERQNVVFTNNTVQGNNTKGEFEGINISKKGGVGSVVFADFTISGNTPSLKYRYNKDVILDASCTGAQSFEKEN